MLNRLKVVLGLFIVVFCLTACGSSKLKYVVYRDVPQQPAFTVLPASYTVADFRFKSAVESSLITLGLSVIEAPLSKQPEMKAESTALRARRDGQLHSTEKSVAVDQLVVASSAYDQGKADYVILVNADTDVIKITRRTTREIQAVIEYTVLDKAGSRFIKLHDTLANLGFKIKTVSEKEKLKMEYPLKEKSLMRH